MTVELPPPPTGAESAPTPRRIGYYALRELVGEVVAITAVEDVDGVPVIVVDTEGDAARYLCTDSWAEQGATALQAHFEVSGASEPVVARVVERGGHVGFENVSASA